uniref:Uncharacterized protein n=1 Tax=Kalanchoe fedtschenkoi TaxID=63787 RepID=A0A7N0UXX6_KALFE
MNEEWRRRRRGCRHRPWKCNPAWERGRRRRRKCCRNRCVDVYSDVNHCGFCRRRCPFGWSCCARRCVDTRFSRRHCGRCFNRCPHRTSCYMGMCGYADEFAELPQQPDPPLDETPETDLLVDDEYQQPPAHAQPPPPWLL